MKTMLIAAAAIAVLSGCAPAVTSAAASSQDVAVAEIQSTLTDAVTVTKTYGQQHLGHYLGLNRKALAKAGYTPPAGVTLTVSIDHLETCLLATHTGLPETNEWQTATVDTKDTDPRAGGACPSDALRTLTITGD